MKFKMKAVNAEAAANIFDRLLDSSDTREVMIEISRAKLRFLSKTLREHVQELGVSENAPKLRHDLQAALNFYTTHPECAAYDYRDRVERGVPVSIAELRTGVSTPVPLFNMLFKEQDSVTTPPAATINLENPKSLLGDSAQRQTVALETIARALIASENRAAITDEERTYLMQKHYMTMLNIADKLTLINNNLNSIGNAMRQQTEILTNSQKG